MKKLILLFLSVNILGKPVVGSFAYVNKPVIDGFGSPNFTEYEKVESPLLGNCNRLHQLLFNEVVRIKEIKKNKVLVECGSFVFSGMHGSDQFTLWIFKDDITGFKAIQKKISEFIPDSPCHQKFKKPKLNSEYIIINKPYKNFSTGTRFVKTGETNNEYEIAYIQNKKIIKDKISKNLVQKSLKNKKRDAFVNFIKYLTNISPKIRYIWGGTSYSTDKSLPLKGFDCSGLILRAAQIAQIPYFYKNSLTISAYLEQINDASKIQKGDIIWFPGHVIVILDPKTGLCAEANGYYECLHTIYLKDIFKNIDSFEKMLNKKELLRLLPNGKSKILTQFKILKLPIE